MPIYDFECKDCGQVYDEYVKKYDETQEYPEVSCPKCQSNNKIRLISACGYQFANPQGTDRWNSESTGHDYRFKYNLPNVQKERENAMRKSHMGSQPYKEIDDISSGKHFGEVQ